MANQTIYNCILERIRVAEPESVFVSTDYVDLADVNTVRQCLSRMEQTGELQRIMRGVYYRPVFSQLLGEYEAPSPHHVAQALARKFNWSIAPSGATALNLLGLSTQVPAKWSYYCLIVDVSRIEKVLYIIAALFFWGFALVSFLFPFFF